MGRGNRGSGGGGFDLSGCSGATRRLTAEEEGWRADRTRDTASHCAPSDWTENTLRQLEHTGTFWWRWSFHWELWVLCSAARCPAPKHWVLPGGTSAPMSGKTLYSLTDFILTPLQVEKLQNGKLESHSMSVYAEMILILFLMNSSLTKINLYIFFSF